VEDKSVAGYHLVSGYYRSLIINLYLKFLLKILGGKEYENYERYYG
jgi:hypothetical protein